MKIQWQDLYHGAALTQIAEHDSFKALNKVDAKYGHYLVNHDRRLLVKYAKSDTSPWQFTFSPEHLETLQEDDDSGSWTYLVLVCGTETICALTWNEISQLIDVSNPTTQWIRVEWPGGGTSMRVHGSLDSLPGTIPHNRFPSIIFAQ